MLKKFNKMSLIVMVIILSFAGIANAMNLDVGLKGFGGLAGGTTDSSAKTGKIGYAAGGGLILNFYAVDLGKVLLGASSGLEYLYIAYESETDLTLPFPPFEADLTAGVNYSYLKIPLTLRGAFRVSDTFIITADAGTFFGFFIGGKSDNTYDPEMAPFLENGEVDLDKDTTEALDIGLRFAAGVEIGITENMKLSPGVQFDFGLRDTSKDDPISPSSKDTFWEINAVIGLVYRLF